jgi:act minimal PKS acyl carrier protein
VDREELTMTVAVSLVTLSDLDRILLECNRGEPVVEIDAGLLDVSFYEIGYDSLLLLQAIDRVSEEFDVRIPEELLELAETPRMLLEMIDRCGYALRG